MDKKKKILISISSLLAALVIAVLVLTATGTFDSILNPNISTNALETDDVSSRNAKLSTSSPISSQITYMDEYGHEIEDYSDVEHGSTVKVLVNKTDAETETEYALYNSYYRDNNNKTYKLEFTETEDGYESEFIVPDVNTVNVNINAYAAENSKTMKAEHNGIEVSLTGDAIPKNATDLTLDTEASSEDTNSLLNLSGHQSSYVFNAALYNNKKETNLDGDTYMEINGILNDIPEGSSAIVNMYHILDTKDAISAAIEDYDLYLGPTKSSGESEDEKDKESEYGQFMSGNIIKITEKDLSKKYPKETKLVQSISGEKDTIYCQVNTLGDGALWEDNGTVYAKIDSLSTYAYTVDFTYNDYTYSIPGESSIKLSELIENLGIDISISDVTDVTFTNESLVRIDKEDGDWDLVSLVAFKSDELLSLQMSNGDIINIKVTDNSGSWSNLVYEDITLGASWDASCSVSGSTVTVNITVTFDAVSGDYSEYQLWVNGTKQKTSYRIHYVDNTYALSYSYTVTADSSGKVTPTIKAVVHSYNTGNSYTIGTISPSLTYAAYYTVTYNANGGSGEMASSTATYGQAFTTRQNAYSRAGYTFVGWNESSDGSGTWWDIKNYYHGSYSAGASGSYGVYEGAGSWTWSYAKDLTLYAQWKANTINVTFDQQGGTGGSTSMQITYDTAQGHYPDITVPTRTGYTFNGYYTAKNGGGVQYLNSAGNSVRKWDLASNTTLYAYWKATQGTIYYRSGNYAQGVYGTANNVNCNSLDTWSLAKLNGNYVTSSWSIESTDFNAWNVASLFTPPTGYNYAPDNASYYIYNQTKNTMITINKDSNVWRTFDQGSINFKDLVTAYPSLISYGDTLHFHAIYTPKTVTVKFVGNGATGGGFASTQTFTYGVSNQKFTGTLEKTGYSFVCWSSTSSGTSGYSLNSPVTDSWINTNAGKTVTLYAVWNPINNYTYYYTGKKFYYAQATEITDYAKSNVTMVDGTKPTGISQNGYLGKPTNESGSAIGTHNITSTAFDAWDPASLFVAPAGYSYPATDQAYRIQAATTDWKKSYWLTGTSDKATGTVAADKYEEATVFDGDSVDVSAYWGYHLLFFPNWQINTYTITYKDGNNTITSGLGGSYNSTYTIEDKVGLPTYSKSYYTFNGWRLTAVSDASDNGRWGTLNTTTFSSGYKFGNTGHYGNVTLSAIFTPNTYSVTINNNGSTYKTIYEVYATRYEETKGSGTSISKITIPTRSGYEFMGVYTGANGAGTKVIDANGNIVAGTTSFTSNTTIYVYWKVVGYFVNYNGNGSDSGSMSTQLIYSNQSTALTKNAFKKEGYTFVGWTRDTSTEVVYYKDQASVINIANPGETITLYAVWQDDNAMIFVDSNTGDYPIISSTATNTGYKYMIQETASTPGYIMDGTIYVVDVNEITKKYTVTSYANRTDAENGTNGTVITKDASIPSTGKQAGLVNVQFENTPNSFELIKTNSSGTVITSGVTNAKVKFWTENASNNTDYIATTDNGVTGVKNNTTLSFDSAGKIKLERLTPGTWYYQEISAPTGYTIDSSVHSFVVTEDGYISEKVSYSEKLVNTPASEIYLALKKTNEHTGAVVPYVWFDISTSADFSTYDTDMTYTDGFIVLFNSGNKPTSTTYYLREAPLNRQNEYGISSKALEGMTINSDVYKIQFNSSYSSFTVTNVTTNKVLASNTNTFTIQHANPVNEWNIYKYDENDEPLSDVTFRLWNDAGDEYELTTDESGYTETVYGLTSGTWYYQEVNTNDGYLVDDTVYVFRVRSDTHEITYDENVYTVTYDPNGGTGTMYPSTATYNESFTPKTNEYMDDGYSKPYYDFNGWNTSADGTGTWWTGSAIYTYTSNLTLYAQWRLGK